MECGIFVRVAEVEAMLDELERAVRDYATCNRLEYDQKSVEKGARAALKGARVGVARLRHYDGVALYNEEPMFHVKHSD